MQYSTHEISQQVSNTSQVFQPFYDNMNEIGCFY
jgi:hypothetical protein